MMRGHKSNEVPTDRSDGGRPCVLGSTGAGEKAGQGEGAELEEEKSSLAETSPTQCKKTE